MIMDKSKLKPFIKLAKQTDSVDEFIDKVRDIQVSYEVSEWFEEEYNSTGMLSIEKASEDFIEDVEQGKYESVENSEQRSVSDISKERSNNPYLYRRKEIRF